MRLELFSCAGGMAEGFRRAGLPFDLAVDADPVHCDSYQHNLGHRPLCMDVRDMLRLVATTRMGWCELLVADPPCTPWSRAGKRRGTEDERDMLGVTIEVLRWVRPRAWMIANVPGLDDGPNWETVVQPVIGGFAAQAGYCVDYVKLDAADYGVPQHRVRPFWFGHRWGTPCIRWPSPTHCSPAAVMPVLPGIGALQPWVTCRDALGHLPPDQLGRPMRTRSTAKHPAARPDEPALTITAGGSRRQCNHLEWPWPRPATTILAHANGHLAPPGHHDRWPWNRPATTVYAGTNGQLGAPGKGSPGSRPGAIALSVRAATILQGFPETWHFAGRSKAAQWRQIGQAMPPPLAEAVARSIAAQLFAAQLSNPEDR